MRHSKAGLPGLSACVPVRRGSTPPAHLNGSLPGDFGWDPLGLGADPDRLKWFAEVQAAPQAPVPSTPVKCPFGSCKGKQLKQCLCCDSTCLA